MICVIDTGTNNMRSVVSALDRVGLRRFRLSTQACDVEAADLIILPGVGAFGDVMTRLRTQGLVDPIRSAVLGRAVPILGICVGMQLLAESSEEFGSAAGLGLVPGKVRRLDPGATGDKVPNIGWMRATVEADAPPFFAPLDGRDLYHVHSYCFNGEPADIPVTIEFGGQPVATALCRGHVVGVQFHPEKSQDAGLDFLLAYVRHFRPDALRPS